MNTKQLQYAELRLLINAFDQYTDNLGEHLDNEAEPDPDDVEQLELATALYNEFCEEQLARLQVKP